MGSLFTPQHGGRPYGFHFYAVATALSFSLHSQLLSTVLPKGSHFYWTGSEPF
jgi:hypothetical protein